MYYPVARPHLMSWCRIAFAATLVGASILGAGAARADYPERPVRVFLSYAAGGIADVTMRLVAQKLSEKMGQQFVVENRPGAGGINSAMAVKTAAADGYALLLNGNASAISVSLFKSLPFDVLKDFASISVMAQFDMLLATRADGDIGTVAKLVERARAEPGKLNFGTVASGSTQHLAAEMFKGMTGIQVATVTFRSTPDLITALLRGDVDAGFDFYAAFSSTLQDNKLKILASAGERRATYLQDVPTVKESGWPDYVVSSWNALSAPAGTPPAVIAKLNREVNEALKAPDLQARAVQFGMEAVGSTPEAMTQRMISDIARWRGVIEKLGLQK